MTRRDPGFSLIEVVLSVAILSFIIAGVSAVLVRQAQSSQVQGAQRDLEENGRLALLEIARNVRMAGYGIDPTAAFDFGRYACTTPDTPSTCNGGGRDRTDAPDELVLSYRDPTFSRSVTLTGGGPYTLTLGAPLTQGLKTGRIVELVCTYATRVAYLALISDANAGDVVLAARLVNSSDGYFPNTAPTDTCFNTSSTSAVLIERIRYFIANDTDGTPSLFRERGRGGNELLYRGIEDLQLTYDIGQPQPPSPFAADGGTPAAAPGCTSADGGAKLWSFGACPGVQGAPSATATPDGGYYVSWQDDTYDVAARYMGNPANIRNVNIFVVARSIRPSSDKTGDAVPVIANRAARGRDSYHRSILSISEQPLNLLGRAWFQPLPNNVGGG